MPDYQFNTNLGPAQQQGMNIGDMLNLARGVQAYQQAQQANPLELQRLKAEAKVAEETAAPRIRAAESTAQKSASEAEVSRLQSMQAHLSNARRESASLLSKDNLTSDDLRKFYEDNLKNMIADPESLKRAVNQAMSVVPKDANPSQLRKIIGQDLAKTMSAESQVERLFPAYQMLGTGAQTVPITTGGALAVQTPGRIAGPGIESELPPTTQVIEPSGATRLIGPISQRGVQNLQTGVGPAQAGLQQGVATTISGDWQQTASNAQQAPQRIAVFQNIKRFAPEAFTGVGGSRKELAAGIANAIGLSAYETEKVATEELAKNSALLALAGGNTDAARALAEVANPNKKLNEKAIKAIANQMIGIENMNVAKEKFLAPSTNDANQYMQRKLQFNQVADPRLFQEMSAEDVSKLKASMSPAERAEMSKKIQMARQLGIIQ